MAEQQLQELLNRMVAKGEQQDERLLAQQNQIAEQQSQMVEQQNRMAEQQNQIAALLQTMQNPPPVTVDFRQPQVADAVIKAEKVQKINFNLRKSSRLKPFKISAELDIKLFLKKFDEELKTMKVMVGLNDVLEKEEFVPIFRSCLDFPVVERVTQVLLKKAKTWENITIPELRQLMLEEFGSKQTDVANVLKQFGPQRLVKTPDESVAEFYYRWHQNIPEVMKPSDENGRKDFVDLIHRSMFYISLEDEFIQKALSDLKEPNPDIKKYFDEACNAESRRQSFKDISQSSTSIESKGVNISKISYKKKWVNKSDKTGTSPSVRPKTAVSTHGDDAKGENNGQNQQNSSDNFKTQSSNQNKANKKWCDFHKYNNSHTSERCSKLKAKNKTIKKVEEAQDNDDIDETQEPCFFGSFE